MQGVVDKLKSLCPIATFVTSKQVGPLHHTRQLAGQLCLVPNCLVCLVLPNQSLTGADFCKRAAVMLMLGLLQGHIYLEVSGSGVHMATELQGLAVLPEAMAATANALTYGLVLVQPPACNGGVLCQWHALWCKHASKLKQSAGAGCGLGRHCLSAACCTAAWLALCRLPRHVLHKLSNVTHSTLLLCHLPNNCA